MAASIYIYCPSGEVGPDRDDLEEALEAFFGDAATDCGAGGGDMGFNLDFELADGEDPQVWADRLKRLLADLGEGPEATLPSIPTAGSRGRSRSGWR